MASFSPQAFGKYFLVDKIATGGMAEIFKAKTYSHGGFENLVVIKRILPHIGANEDFIEMFIDEAKVSVALQHPNIVRIYDFGKILDNFFIAMECVDGKDVRNILRKLARQKRYLPPRLAALIAHETAKGLHYAHEKADLQGNPYGIVHRDISPSNVIVSYDGEVKVADFGIAKAESNAYETRDGMLKGKFEYMSPEQATGKEIDRRSDLFSLGIILWECLTGRRLFKTESEIATLKKIRDCDFPPPSKVNPQVPAVLEQVVMRLLSQSRKDRYQSAREVTEDLRQLLLPGTPDSLSAEFTEFMKDLFGEEIEDERTRLEAHSEIAQQLRQNTPHDAWDGSTSSTMSSAPTTNAGTKVVGLALGGVAAMLAVVVIVLGVLIYVVYNMSVLEPDPVIEQVVVTETTGGIDILVLPAAAVQMNGEDAGEGSALALSELEPGTYQLRFEAEGHEILEEEVEVVAGESTKVSRTLVKIPEEKVAPKPKKPTTPVVLFDSTPSGASIAIDGQTIGTTPMRWTGGSAGSDYRVTLSKGGYQRVSGSLSGLVVGKRTVFEKRLPKVSQPGSLTVLVIGAGWAHVYVNDEKLPKTAPLKNYELKAGTYTIRVENPAAGLAYTEDVVVGSGGAVTVRATPQ